MVARAGTVAFQGIDVLDVDVQVEVASGLPAFTIVGLPDKAVGESRERVRAALGAMGLSLPPKRVTVNLAPADIAKEGSHFDLPIALGILGAMGVLSPDETARLTAMGELALDGGIAPVLGVLPAAIHAAAVGRGFVCAAAQGGEAVWAGDIDVIAAPDLLALVQHIKGTHILPTPTPKIYDALPDYPDLIDVKGQETAKRALEITAVGGHNLLMAGPPGSGKSMLAHRLPGLLPPLSSREILEVSMIQSLAGELTDGGLTHRRPFRDPHHSASVAALVGGGHRVRPGEISLAHRGVLFLDELPEFHGKALEALRQPMETGRVSIARANSHVMYPADFQLVAAMNPCRCGYLADPGAACSRAPRCGADYQAKISGPLMDRMDVTIDVPAVKPSDLSLPPPGEGSADVAARVAAARYQARARAERIGLGATPLNARLDGDALAQAAPMVGPAKTLLADAAQSMRLSARGYHRVIRVARTLADLDATDIIGRPHIAEALSYRQRGVMSAAPASA